MSKPATPTKDPVKEAEDAKKIAEAERDATKARLEREKAERDAKHEEMKAQAETDAAIAESHKKKREANAGKSTPLDGKAEVDDKSGQLATTMGYVAMQTAADHLTEKLKDKLRGAASVLVVDNLDVLSADVPVAVIEDMFTLTTENMSKRKKANDELMGAAPSPLGFVAESALSLSGTISAFADIAALFREDVQIKGRDVTISNASLIAHVAHKFADKVVIENFRLSSKLMLSESLVEPRKLREELSAQAKQLLAQADTEKDPQKKQSLLNAQKDSEHTVEAFDKFIKEILAVPEGKTLSPFAQAAIRKQLHSSNISHLLYLHVDDSGGDVIVRQRLWSSAGVLYTAGATITYILADTKGKIQDGGTISARAEYNLRFPGLLNWSLKRDIHTEIFASTPLKLSVCGWLKAMWAANDPAVVDLSDEVAQQLNKPCLKTYRSVGKGDKTMAQSNTTPVDNPTWYSDIRYMFTQLDIDHMKAQDLDLTSYTDVVAKAGNIYQQVAIGNMPPGAQWPQDQVTTFLNWMTNGYPKGTYALSQNAASLRAAVTVSNASRIRKEITTLSPTELQALKTAFSGIMAKDPSDPNSYFVQAGYHWLPAPNLYCQHHVPAYNPWHRAYLVSFENALRSIPGCENVTLPYWDITTPFPDVLKKAPFDSYTLPQDIGEGFTAGYVTTRYSYSAIQENLVTYQVTDDINRARTKTDWEDFHGLFAGAANNTIISAHDGGHVSIGDTMSNPLIAAFDPVFWFFHANWDRLFWEWQKQMQATNLNGLLSTINKETDPVSYRIFTIQALKALAPFTSNTPNLDTISTIDSENSLDVDYQDFGTPATMNFLAKTQSAIPASQKFTLQTERVNVSVQGLNRLKIPGSFTVHLLKDGKRIASSGFFQPNEAEKCETCVENAIVHFDFELPLAQVSGGKLSVEVEPVDKRFVGARFPNKLMGNPTVDVHLLMNTE